METLKSKTNAKLKNNEYRFKTACNSYYSVFLKDDPYAKYQFLSPFELKDTLDAVAKESSEKNGKPIHNAGRGNPNFLSTKPREAFSLLNTVANIIAEEEYPKFGISLMPDEKGISKRFYKELDKHKSHVAYKHLYDSLNYAKKITEFDIDKLIHQMVIAVLGSYYPVPPRILDFHEIILENFLAKTLFRNKNILGNVKIFATEGAAAGIMYTFNSLQINGLIKKRDKIGLITPIFSPYLEIPLLQKFDMNMICIECKEELEWDIPDEELDKIKDKTMKALFIVNPTNPTAQSLSKKTVKKIADIVRKYNKDLIIIEDCVYAPFVDEFYSLFNEIPENTICIYSFSKYFGVTGWRLGLVAIYNNNIYDKRLLPNLDSKMKKTLKGRYNMVTLNVESIIFIERIVLDSREVAEAHTGGLSTPQQTIMTLFAIQELMDDKREYGKEIRKILLERMNNLCHPIKYPFIHNKLSSFYYIIIDLIKVAKILHGHKFAEHLHKHVDPLDIVFTLAKEYNTIVLPGVGFAAPPWSIRVSLANLRTENYKFIGLNIKNTMAIFYKKYSKIN